MFAEEKMKIVGIGLMAFGLAVAAAHGATNSVAPIVGTNLLRQIAALPPLSPSNDVASIVSQYETFFTNAPSLYVPDELADPYGKALYSFATFLRDSGRSDDALSVIDKYTPQAARRYEIYKGLMILKSVILIDQAKTQTGEDRDKTLNEAEFTLIDLKW